MKTKITKAEIITAIAQEPLLFPGNWMVLKGDAEKATVQDACRVCAVGSVLRRKLSPAFPVERWLFGARDARGHLDVLLRKERHLDYNLLWSTDAGAWAELAEEALAMGHHLRALSLAFEGIANDVCAGESCGDADVWNEDGIEPSDYLSDQPAEARDALIAIIRTRTIAWVREHFPSTISVDFGTAKLRKR